MDGEIGGEFLGEYDHEDVLAKKLGKHTRTLKRWRTERKGPRPTFVGEKVYYRKASVREWLLGQEQEFPQRKSEGPRRRSRSRAPRQSVSAMS